MRLQTIAHSAQIIQGISHKSKSKKNKTQR